MSERPQNKHLKPYVKGQSGNPGGKPKGTLTKADVEKLFQKFAGKTKDELQLMVQDPKSTMLEIMVASVMVKAAKDGDAARLQFLLDRAVGKVKEQMEVENTILQPQIIVTLPDNKRSAIDSGN